MFNTIYFLKGVSRVVDFFGNLHHDKSSSPIVSPDKKALRRDWEMIGLDLRNAIKAYEPHTRKSK